MRNRLSTAAYWIAAGFMAWALLSGNTMSDQDRVFFCGILALVAGLMLEDRDTCRCRREP